MSQTQFPDDLVQLDGEWVRTYETLALRSAAADTTRLRRHLIALSCRLASHPFWRSTDRSSPTRVELRRRARAADALGTR